MVLALDQISDPQNLGTILRSAAFFGVDALLVMKNRAAEVTPLVARVAVGGAELVRIFRITNLARSLEILKGVGFWIYGLDERGERTLAQTEFDAKTVLVVGAEGEGLRHRTKQLCDELVRIPGGQDGLESLNAGVATAVALAEVFRGRDGGAKPRRARRKREVRSLDAPRMKTVAHRAPTSRRARGTCPSACRPGPGRRC